MKKWKIKEKLEIMKKWKIEEILNYEKIINNKNNEEIRHLWIN